MATYYSQGNGSWSTMAIWNDAANGSGSAPANLAAMDGCAVTLQAGHNVLMDADCSGMTGLLTVTITSAAVTPAKLYWANGTSGTLKIRTGYNLVGTNAAVKGQLVANSDGSFAGTTALAFANKAIILLEGTSILDATYLDCRFYCYEPTTKYVETYKTAYTCTNQATDIALATDVITFTGAPPAAGTAVCVRSSGTLPTPLRADVIYYVRTVAGNTCKLATLNADINIVDITATGAGTLTMYDGHTNLATATMNVIQNVSAETGWTADAGHDAVSLIDWGPVDYDPQIGTLATINAGTIILGANVDSAQYPCSRIYLSSRNVSIRSSCVSDITIINKPVSCVFGCEIQCSTATGTTFHGLLFTGGSNNTISGTIMGITYAMYNCINNSVTGLILSSRLGAYGCTNTTVSGTVGGCLTGFSFGCKNILSGTFFGNSSHISDNANSVLSGTFLGGSSLFSNSCYNKFTGAVLSCNMLLYGACVDNELLGVVIGSNYAHSLNTGTAYKNKIRNASSTIMDLQGRNSGYSFTRISYENYNRIDGSMKILDCWGDIFKTLCDGTGDAPSVDPDGGNGYCLEASNIQSNLTLLAGRLRIIEEQRIWLTSGSHTITYKLQTTYAAITAGNLKLTCWYIGTDGVLTEATNAPAITTRANAADWTQTLAVTIAPSVDGWASFSIDLMQYESGDEVYVWPTPTIT